MTVLVRSDVDLSTRRMPASALAAPSSRTSSVCRDRVLPPPALPKIATLPLSLGALLRLADRLLLRARSLRADQVHRLDVVVLLRFVPALAGEFPFLKPKPVIEERGHGQRAGARAVPHQAVEVVPRVAPERSLAPDAALVARAARRQRSRAQVVPLLPAGLAVNEVGDQPGPADRRGQKTRTSAGSVLSRAIDSPSSTICAWVRSSAES